jgi:hypothetical protein
MEESSIPEPHDQVLSLLKDGPAYFLIIYNILSGHAPDLEST